MQGTCKKNRIGFTLIELVVVVIIIAILAAVAVPKFKDRTNSAREAATLQSLVTIRSAIELHRADVGSYPADISTGLTAYIKGAFPKAPLAGDVNTVSIISSDPITSTDVTGVGGWLYNATTGEVRINHATYVSQ
ncbi:MAG: prepilin-type N-terminal cleavage/methylation domain-containing protein [Planctomycetales bacterium]|nr:prepilin-type N-terminal cleavage/methylation domain-containing protein [Planctomycetales bacterium]